MLCYAVFFGPICYLRRPSGQKMGLVGGWKKVISMMPNRIWTTHRRIIWFAAWKRSIATILIESKNMHQDRRRWRILLISLAQLPTAIHLWLVVRNTFPAGIVSCSFSEWYIWQRIASRIRFHNKWRPSVAESRQICCKYAPAYRFHHSHSYQRGPLTDQYVENGISCRYAVFTFQHITQPYLPRAGCN